MAEKSDLDGQKLKVPLDEFVEVGLHGRNERLQETLTKNRKLVHSGMYFIAPMLLLLFLMMCSSRRRPARNLRSQVFTHKGALRPLE
jgi:hypothetical protein